MRVAQVGRLHSLLKEQQNFRREASSVNFRRFFNSFTQRSWNPKRECLVCPSHQRIMPSPRIDINVARVYNKISR